MVLQPEKNANQQHDCRRVTLCSLLLLLPMETLQDIYRFIIPIYYATNRVPKEIHNYIFNINRKNTIAKYTLLTVKPPKQPILSESIIWFWFFIVQSGNTSGRITGDLTALNICHCCIRWLQLMTKWLMMWRSGKRNGGWGWVAAHLHETLEIS